jgi:hypothetical protein
VKTGTVAAQFLFWQYLFRIFSVGSLQCISSDIVSQAIKLINNLSKNGTKNCFYYETHTLGLRIQAQTTLCQHMLRYLEPGMPEVGAQQLQELHGLAG